MKFLSPEVALYLYKSSICPCIAYCYHVLTSAPSYISEKSGYAGLSVLHLLPLLNPELIVEM